MGIENRKELVGLANDTNFLSAALQAGAGAIEMTILFGSNGFGQGPL
jgi:hypothetical protein